MDSLIAALVLLVVLALTLAVVALPVVLVVRALRTPAGPPPTIRPEDWTDDDEIAARDHR